MKNRTLGINFDTSGNAEVLLWAPKANKVDLLLKDSGKKIPLLESDYGYWQLQTNAIKPGDRYMFTLDDEMDRPDPASLAQEDTVHGASIAKDLNAFKWTDGEWENLPLDKYIIYEIHVGTFSEEETFEGIEKKLDHLIDLGITAIEIMPVAQFPGNRNWGYDGVLPFAVQNSYGGVDGLQKLVNTCHQKGIAVILDCVYNHVGPEGNYFNDFGQYFTNKYSTPWGDAINFDDEWCDGVRHYFIENALMWFRDFHIDALRLDAVHAKKDFSAIHILRDIKLKVNELMAHTGKKHHLIVELDLNDTRYIDPLEKNGFGMDAQWVDEFHHALRVTAGTEKTGYYADFNGIEQLAKSYTDAYVYDGQFSAHRKKKFGIKAKENPGEQFIVFSQNHDQVGNRMLGERTSVLHNNETVKLLAGAVFVSPFLTMLFMGEEYGETNPFLYFVSHTDAELAELVRQGRKSEFAAFHTVGEAPDPLDEATFKKSKLQWQLVQKEQHQQLFQFYKKLISLKKHHPVLKTYIRKNLSAEIFTEQSVLVLQRWYQDQYITVYLNFSKEAQTLHLPGSSQQWKLLLNSADKAYGGDSYLSTYKAAGDQITIAPQSIVIYESSAHQAS